MVFVDVKHHVYLLSAMRPIGESGRGGGQKGLRSKVKTPKDGCVCVWGGGGGGRGERESEFRPGPPHSCQKFVKYLVKYYYCITIRTPSHHRKTTT